MLSGIPFMGQRFGMGGTQMPNPGGGYVLSPGGGLDVMGTLQQQNKIATNFVGNPGSGPMGSPMSKPFGAF